MSSLLLLPKPNEVEISASLKVEKEKIFYAIPRFVLAMIWLVKIDLRKSMRPAAFRGRRANKFPEK